MLHFHATKKLLNTGRIDPVLYLSIPAAGQELHNWYVTLCGSGFPGKFLMLYVHQPSLLTVMVKGKTIASTVDQFRKQLRDLLSRQSFPKAFIEREMSLTDEYIIGKTNDRSMLAFINQMVYDVTVFNYSFASYEEIDTGMHEENFMDWLYKAKGQRNYQIVMDYWKEKLGNFS